MAQGEEDALRREVAALREQIGLQRGVESLRAQVAVAKAEIPSAGDRGAAQRRTGRA